MSELNESLTTETTEAAGNPWESITEEDIEGLMNGADGWDEGAGEADEADQAEDAEQLEDTAEAEGEDEAGNPATEEADSNTAGEVAEPDEKPEADQSFELKYMGEVKTVAKDEAVALAQKGMDYDRVKGKLETLTAEKSKADEVVSFIADLAKQQGLDVASFIDQTKASLLAEKDGIDQKTALERVRLERERAEFEAERKRQSESKAEQDGAAALQESRQKAIREFVESNTDPKTGELAVKIADIPQSVWQDFDKTGDLIGAYARYENTQLKQKAADLEQRLAAEKKNKENKAKSTGTRSTAGNKSDTGDPWLADLEKRF